MSNQHDENKLVPDRLAKNLAAKAGDDPQILAVADEVYREKMNASDDPKAQEWSKLDAQAQKGEKRIDEYQQEIDKRKDMGLTLYETEKQLSDARNGRDAHMVNGRPPLFDQQARSEFDSTSKSLNSEIRDHQGNLAEMTRKSTPETIEGLQERMEAKQVALEELVAQRQGIAKLPSEHAQGQSDMSMQDRIEQSRTSWSPSANDAQANAGNGQGLTQSQDQAQSDRQPDGTAVGHKMMPRYDRMAESMDDRKFVDDLVKDQETMRQRLGHPANDTEMQAFLKEKEQAQQKQTQIQEPGQDDKFQQQVQQRRSQSQ